LTIASTIAASTSAQERPTPKKPPASPADTTPGAHPPGHVHPGAGADRLEALTFFVGTWAGEGTSTYGAYSFRNVVSRRNDWLLVAGEVLDSGGRRVVESLGVLGYEADGTLVWYAFDQNGAYRLVGTQVPEGFRFEWKEGEASRRFLLERKPDGTLHQRTTVRVVRPPDPEAVEITFDSIAKREP
jgi:hypothetical protein